MSKEQHTINTSPTILALAFSLFGMDYWIECLGRNKTPDFPHPDSRRWGLHKSERNTAIYAGPIYFNTGRT